MSRELLRRVTRGIFRFCLQINGGQGQCRNVIDSFVDVETSAPLYSPLLCLHLYTHVLYVCIYVPSATMSAPLYSPLICLHLCTLRYYVCISVLSAAMPASLYSLLLCLHFCTLPFYVCICSLLYYVCISVLSATMSAPLFSPLENVTWQRRSMLEI